MTNTAGKFCADKLCERVGQKLPLDEFTVNRQRKDGHSMYCCRCTQRHGRERRQLEKRPTAPRKRGFYQKPKPLTDSQRILRALKGGEKLEFRALARRAKLTFAQLSDALARIHGHDRQVISKNGTGPRVYFLNPSPTPSTPLPRAAATEPASDFSWSSIDFLHPVIGGRK